MCLTYVIADLHGRFDLLEMALDAIEKHAWAAEVPPKIITLGDYVDRGPQSRQIIERLMAEKTDSVGMVILKGNHEDMMVQCLIGALPWPMWQINGGDKTLLSYGHPPTGNVDPAVVPKAHISWLAGLPLYHEDKHRVYVHAWVDSSVPLDRQKAARMLWEIYPHNANYGHRLTGRHVVHGHVQHETGPILRKGRTEMDTWAYHTGRLVVGVFDDDTPGGPIDLIEIKGVPQ